MTLNFEFDKLKKVIYFGYLMNRIYLSVIFLMSVIITGCGSPDPKDNKNATDSKSENVSVSPKNNNWERQSQKDEMRGTETFVTSTKSLNKIYFEPPYSGGSTLILAIKKTESGKDIVFAIDKGQFLCGISGCQVSIKFDDNPIETITVGDSDSLNSNLLFSIDESEVKKFINNLESSKSLIVELPFYQAGKKQFKFNIEGFLDP